MGAGEFMTWLALYQIEPWGELREDLRAARALALTANTSRDAKKHPKPFTVDEFLFDFWKVPPAQKQALTPAQLAAKFAALTANMEHKINGD